MRNMLGLLFVLVTFNAYSFEIRPIGVKDGANNDKASSEILRYQPDSVAHQCSNLWYLHPANTDPVHELITRIAYPFIYGVKLRAKTGKKPTMVVDTRTWKIPLLAGVEWNDDPEELIRRAYYYNARRNIWKFAYDEANAAAPNTLTRRTHHGDLSFLHSMRGENEDEATTKQRMHKWLEYTYTIAIGDVDPNTVRKTSPYNTLFGRVGCMKNYQLRNPDDCTVMDVLDIHRLYRDGDWQQNIEELATGAIAHMIQDSYSTSHTRRLNGTGKLLEMYTYDAANELHHCESDGLYEKNKPAVEAAIRRTKDLLWLVRNKTPWPKAEPFFNEVFAFQP